MSRTGRTLLLAIGLALAAVAPAQAGIWTPLESGTTENITAIDYQGADRFWFATTNGTIRYREGGVFKTAAMNVSSAGVTFNDIAFQPGGNVGLAVGNGDNVWRSIDAGRNWTKLDPKTITNQFCNNIGPVPPVDVGDMFSVAWGPGDVVYLGGDQHTVLRSQSAGAAFSEVNKTVTGCQMNVDGVSDMFFFPGSTGRNNEQLYFQARQAFGRVYRTSDGLQSAAQPRAESINGTETNVNLTVDPTNTNRIWATNQCGFTCLYVSEDGAANFDCVCTIANQNGENQIAWYDVEYVGGTVVAAGRGGQIVNSVNGRDFFYNKADGPLLTKDWYAVGMASAADAAVGGQGGALVITTTASTVPDIVKPTGTIVGPTQVTAGQPATFTLQAADEGGSGLNLGAITWTSAGLPSVSGQTVNLTFPNTGFFTVRVAFADNAGNTAEATLGVSVRAATGGGGGANALPVSFTGPGNTLSAKIVGRFIRVTMRGAIVPPTGATTAACSGKVTLRIKKGKRTMANRKASLKLRRAACRFSKVVRLRRSKVGKTNALRLTVSHPGNTVLRKSSKSVQLVIRK